MVEAVWQASWRRYRPSGHWPSSPLRISTLRGLLKYLGYYIHFNAIFVISDSMCLHRTLCSIKRMVGAAGTSPLAPLRPLAHAAASPGWSLRAFSVTAGAGRAALARPSATELGSPMETPRASPPQSRSPSGSGGSRAPAGAQAPEPSQGVQLGALPVGGAAAGDWDGQSPEVGVRRRNGNPDPAASARQSGASEARGSAEGPLGIGMSQKQPLHSQNMDPRAGPGVPSPGPGFEAYGFSGTPEAFRAPMRAGLANLPVTPIIPVSLPQQGAGPPRAPLSPCQSPNVRGAAPALPPWKPDALGGEQPRPALGAAARANALWRK